jgi:NAD(P)-dependent dehydrogenase (short-subunit alcohol dehydrogenase family)
MNKTIFITGSSSGLGKAAAKLFQSNGWNVAATMRKPENETELNQLAKVKLYALDVTNPLQIKDAIEKAVADFGKIDVLLNNAGYGLAGVLEALSDEQITRQLETNLLGVIRVTQNILPHFRQNKDGLIVTITSIGGLIAFPLFSLYHATKWALEGWSESLWFEMQSIGVGVKTVSPGGIKTDFAGRSLDMAANPELNEYNDIMSKTMAFFGNPERRNNGSTAEQIAQVVFDAATDGKNQLRYVAGEDAKEMYLQRKAVGDQSFMEGLKQMICD